MGDYKSILLQSTMKITEDQLLMFRARKMNDHMLRRRATEALERIEQQVLNDEEWSNGDKIKHIKMIEKVANGIYEHRKSRKDLDLQDIVFYEEQKRDTAFKGRLAKYEELKKNLIIQRHRGVKKSREGSLQRKFHEECSK